MLQNIRKSTSGTTAKIVVGLIVVSFAFFGIESILLDGGGSEVAMVNGQEISPQELQQAVDTQRRRLFAMMGDNVDPAMLDEDRLKPQSLEALINHKVLVQSAQALKLSISEVEIGGVVGSMEQFLVDGVFSPELYKGLLSEAGFTPGSFKQNLNDDLLVNQVSSGLAASEFVTATELELNARIIAEQRDIRYLTIPQEKFSSSMAPPSEQEITAYYDAHEDDFRTQESVDLDYLELILDDFRQPVAEGSILEAYELASHELHYQTQNRVSHILFETDSDTDVQQRIADAQKKLSAGVSFSKVAKEISDDVGSADRGGDLGYTSGEAFPSSMEEAIAQMEPGVISNPIETDAGIHLIMVTERKPGEVVSLEEMREQLTDEIQTNEARVELLRIVESLRDLTFNADNLNDPAAELDLSLKNEKAVTKNQSEGVFSHSKLLEAAFSEDVLLSGHNSDVIELSGDKFVVIKVRKHNLPETMPLDSVRDDILAAVTEEAVRAAVAAEAKNALAQLRKGLEIDQYATSQGYELVVELGIDRRNTTVPPDILRRVFELPPSSDDVAPLDYITTPNGDAIIIDLLRVSPGAYASLGEEEQIQFKRALTGEIGSLVYQEYQRGLRERAEIKVL